MGVVGTRMISGCPDEISMTKSTIADFDIDSALKLCGRIDGLLDRRNVHEDVKGYFLVLKSAVLVMSKQIEQYEDVMADLMRDSGSWPQDALPPSRLREKNEKLIQALVVARKNLQLHEEEYSHVMNNEDWLIIERVLEKQDERP